MMARLEYRVYHPFCAGRSWFATSSPRAAYYMARRYARQYRRCGIRQSVAMMRVCNGQYGLWIDAPVTRWVSA